MNHCKLHVTDVANGGRAHLNFISSYPTRMKLMTPFIASLLATSSRRYSITGRACFSTTHLIRAPKRNRRATSIPRPSRILSFTLTGCLLATSMRSSTTAVCASGTDDTLEFSPEMIEMDTYNGVIVRLDENTFDSCPILFESRLTASLQQWRNQGKRGIWMHIPPTLSQFIPVCTQLGFDFQFAKPGMLVLTTWLPLDSESRLPHGPTHQVGVGALVLNRKGQMLVVQERTGPASKYQLWKLPTGLLDPGEDIGTAAQRELLEETGLRGTIERILCFRQAHASGDRGSDLFFICLMRLQNDNECDDDDALVLTPQEDEIAAVQWMDMDEFCEQEHWQRSPVYLELNEAMRRAVRERTGLEQHVLDVGFRPGTNAIYVPSSLR